MASERRALDEIFFLLPIITTGICGVISFLFIMSCYGRNPTGRDHIFLFFMSLTYVVVWISLLVYGYTVKAIGKLKFFAVYWTISAVIAAIMCFVDFSPFEFNSAQWFGNGVLSGIANIPVWIFAVPLGGFYEYVPSGVIAFILPSVAMALAGVLLYARAKRSAQSVEAFDAGGAKELEL